MEEMLRVIELIVLIAGLVCLMNEILGACVCNKEGSDYCSNCSESKVIAPKHPLTNEPPQVNLSPVGDNCWCSKQTVEPVVLSETCPKHKTKTCNCEISDSIIENHFADSSLYSTRLSTNIQDDSPSADPVSVSLAIKAGQALAVPEAKLSYGFIQKPIEALPKTFYSSVQEENLFAHKNDVITLHKSMPIEDGRQTDDYLDIDDDRDALANDRSKDLRLTYKQLGYVTERLPNPKFQRVFSSASSSSSSSSSSAHDSIYYENQEYGKNSAYDLDTHQKR